MKTIEKLEMERISFSLEHIYPGVAPIFNKLNEVIDHLNAANAPVEKDEVFETPSFSRLSEWVKQLPKELGPTDITLRIGQDKFEILAENFGGKTDGTLILYGKYSRGMFIIENAADNRVSKNDTNPLCETAAGRLQLANCLFHNKLITANDHLSILKNGIVKPLNAANRVNHVGMVPVPNKAKAPVPMIDEIEALIGELTLMGSTTAYYTFRLSEKSFFQVLKEIDDRPATIRSSQQPTSEFTFVSDNSSIKFENFEYGKPPNPYRAHIQQGLQGSANAPGAGSSK